MQACVPESPTAVSGFLGRLARARGPAELYPARAEAVIKRAGFGLVLEHRCDHKMILPGSAAG